MALARVVMFDGSRATRIPGDAVRDAQLPAAGRVPAKEIILVHDPDAEKSVVLLLFDSEDDYRQGDEALSAMPAGETPGQRTRVAKYEVAMRMVTCESAAGYPVGNGGCRTMFCAAGVAERHLGARPGILLVVRGGVDSPTAMLKKSS